ncbi:hypothetical protein E2C01_079617 [Portunus trituberculatus]|uniref:Uncharacterized protein n=1 Tax=Portunus trituberculatus TaxID=210409 RepID=A0A5B7ITU4_PORTR|nr:hypothetical protein [Portunus trituberculatus]
MKQPTATSDRNWLGGKERHAQGISGTEAPNRNYQRACYSSDPQSPQGEISKGGEDPPSLTTSFTRHAVNANTNKVMGRIRKPSEVIG